MLLFCGHHAPMAVSPLAAAGNFANELSASFSSSLFEKLEQIGILCHFLVIVH
ncbi:MAG: hypothetical protein JWP57_2696 [Spirosoma sp.]|nr:hypothetical protein [Spirosoma sp.]